MTGYTRYLIWTCVALLCALPTVASAQPLSWQLAGPPAAGELHAVWWDGVDAIVLAGEDGSIVRSDDAGRTWAFVESGVRTPLKDIVRTPTGHLVIVGGDGSVLRSGDAGASFEDHSVADMLEDLVAVVYARERLIALGDQGTLLVSEDDGVTWSEWASRGSDLVLHSTDLWVSPDLEVFVAAQDTVAVWRPGADAYRQVLSCPSFSGEADYRCHGIWGDGSGLILVAGYTGAVYRSVDGGESFESVATTASSHFTAFAEAGNVLYALGHDAVWLTEDAGETWLPFDFKGMRAGVGSGSGRLVGVGRDVLVTTPDGTLLTPVDLVSPTRNDGLRHIEGDGAGHVYAWGDTPATLYHQAAGEGWTPFEVDVTGQVYVVLPVGDGVVYLGGGDYVTGIDWNSGTLMYQSQFLARCVDHGASCEVLISEEGKPPIEAVFSAESSDGMRIILSRTGGGVLVSNDDGSSFTEVMTTGSYSRALLHGDDGSLTLVGEGLLTSDDAGQTWIEVPWDDTALGEAPQRIYTLNAGSLLFTLSDGRLVRSDDGAVTIEEVATLPVWEQTVTTSYFETADGGLAAVQSGINGGGGSISAVLEWRSEDGEWAVTPVNVRSASSTYFDALSGRVWVISPGWWGRGGSYLLQIN